MGRQIKTVSPRSFSILSPLAFERRSSIGCKTKEKKDVLVCLAVRRWPWIHPHSRWTKSNLPIVLRICLHLFTNGWCSFFLHFFLFFFLLFDPAWTRLFNRLPCVGIRQTNEIIEFTGRVLLTNWIEGGRTGRTAEKEREDTTAFIQGELWTSPNNRCGNLDIVGDGDDLSGRSFGLI